MNKEQVWIDRYLDLLKKALTASLYDESAWSLVVTEKPKLRLLINPERFVRLWLRYRIAKTNQKKSDYLVRTRPFDAAEREKGRDWPLFGYSMVGLRRLDNVQQCVEDVLRNQVPGDFIETGAWRGGTTIFLRALLQAHGVTDRKVWVADSFEGMPRAKDDADGWDFSKKDYLRVSLEQVKANFERFGLLDDQVEFVKGWFCDTLPGLPAKQLAILRLDGDMYSSTMDALRSLYPKVSRGGYVIVDDYYSWPSCRRAVTDYLAEHSLRPEIVTIDDDGAYWRRD